ncbi:hypothetical protein YC2023_031310 [Brassica napus]
MKYNHMHALKSLSSLSNSRFTTWLPRPKGLICVAAARMLNFAVAGNRNQVAVLTAVSPLPPELDAPVYHLRLPRTAGASVGGGLSTPVINLP